MIDINLAETPNGVERQGRTAATNVAVKVLLIEDEPLYASLVRRRLETCQSVRFESAWAEYLKDGLRLLGESSFDLVLLDLTLPDSSGIKTVARVREAAPDVPIVVLTGHDSDQLAVEALQHGAQDYLLKNSDGNLILRSIRYALERSRTQTELLESRRALRSTQMQLLQVEKMDAVGRLASGIAHEVRNPLATIRMGIDYLTACTPNRSSDEIETLSEMEDAVTDAFTIISGLLDFCIPSELSREASDLSTTVREGLPMVRHELEKRRIQLVLRLAEDIPELQLDRRRVQQVILNLILNAMDVMPEGGRICVTSRAGVVGTSPLQGDLELPGRFKTGQRIGIIEIEDTGPGLPEGECEKVFDPFYTLKELGQATGLGLSVSRNIVELHGGHIAIANRPEGGAVVTVVFAT